MQILCINLHVAPQSAIIFNSSLLLLLVVVIVAEKDNAMLLSLVGFLKEVEGGRWGEASVFHEKCYKNSNRRRHL